MKKEEEGLVRSGALAYLVLSGRKPERFVCLSSTFSSERDPMFAEVKLCSGEEQFLPVVVRGRTFRNRAVAVADGTVLGDNNFVIIESTQTPPGQGQPMRLAVGTGGDASVANSMWRAGFPSPSSASAAGLASNVPMQTPLFVASLERPELSALIPAGIKGPLYYGAPFQLLSSYGYLCESLERPGRLSLQLDPSTGCSWRLLPFSTFYTPFAPDGCLAHSPNPTSLLSLECSKNGCWALHRRVYLLGSLCQQDSKDNSQKEPESTPQKGPTEPRPLVGIDHGCCGFPAKDRVENVGS